MGSRHISRQKQDGKPLTCWVTAVAIATRSAQVPTGYAAFSTLAPVTMVPPDKSRAQPTWNFEYGPDVEELSRSAYVCLGRVELELDASSKFNRTVVAINTILLQMMQGICRRTCNHKWTTYSKLSTLLQRMLRPVCRHRWPRGRGSERYLGESVRAL